MDENLLILMAMLFPVDLGTHVVFVPPETKTYRVLYPRPVGILNEGADLERPRFGVEEVELDHGAVRENRTWFLGYGPRSNTVVVWTRFTNTEVENGKDN